MKIYRWLIPFACLYGWVVRVRNFLFDRQLLLHSEKFQVPVICIGNLTVGGTGKTPHTEYLIRQLLPHWRTAVVSRGYKRKTKGYLLATPEMDARDIGDEPWQMKHKFPELTLAVDANRCEAIHHLLEDEKGGQPQVILLDDAYQHRYVKAGLQILLTTHSRLVCHDLMLPAGLLREPFSSIRRADMVIVTKCPSEIDREELRRLLQIKPRQQLFFTRQKYTHLRKVFASDILPLKKLGEIPSLILFTAIANASSLKGFLERQCQQVVMMAYGDHHFFSPQDLESLDEAFSRQPAGSIILTTEKDEARFRVSSNQVSPSVLNSLYVIPMEIEFDGADALRFNQTIMNYVTENQRNS